MNKNVKANKSNYGYLIRKIIRQSKTAILSTDLGGKGWPYGSLVLSSCEHNATPYLFISDLAEHTKAIKINKKISIFYKDNNFTGDPLAGIRFSLLCEAYKMSRDKSNFLINRFVLRHPESAIYANFEDFNIFGLTIKKVHIIGGFGKIFWLKKEDVIGKSCKLLMDSEKSIIDYFDNTKFSDYKIIGVDSEGVDFFIGKKYYRNDFDKEVDSPEQAKREIKKILK